MALNIDAKIEGKLTFAVKNDIRSLKVSKFFDVILLNPSRKCMSLKFTRELFVMTMKKDAKLEEELTCRFKIEMRTLMNFNPSTRKSQKFAL